MLHDMIRRRDSGKRALNTVASSFMPHKEVVQRMFGDIFSGLMAVVICSFPENVVNEDVLSFEKVVQ